MSTYDTPTTTKPQTITVSYWLYIVGAILGIVGAIVLIVALPASIAASQDQLNRLQSQSTNGVDVSGVVTGAAIGGAIFSGVLTLAFSVLTIVFARKMLLGKNWARIVLAVFAVLQIVGAFNIAGTYGVSTLHFVVVLVALILSFLPTSNAWFREMKPATQPVV